MKMDIKTENRSSSKVKNTIILCVLSFLAGGINGFLGTGGGILLIYMLQALTDNEQKDNFATTLCATIPISLISMISYIKAGNIDTSLAQKLVLPAIVGGVIGALVTDKIKTKYLTLLFSLLVIYSGIRMVNK